MALNVLAGIGGLAVVLIALRDVFQSVIVPRTGATFLRVSRYLLHGTWRFWPWFAFRFYRSEKAREEFLGTFAPAHLVTLLVVWVVMLVVGWGLFFYAIRGELQPANLGFGGTTYFAGVSLLTIGYGDIVPHTEFARIMALIAGVSGLGTTAVVISFLFAVFGSFQNREKFVVAFGARAGVPPSGIGLLAVHGYAGLREDLAQILRDGQFWTAEVMESHLAYPILMMFRSSHDYQSWVGTLGSLLDASALVMSAIDPEHLANAQTGGQARVMYDIGRHLTNDFAQYFSFKHPGTAVGVERVEFNAACERLRSAGFALADSDEAWQKFSKLRAVYAGHLNAMARWLEIPPIQWVGDRSLLTPYRH